MKTINRIKLSGCALGVILSAGSLFGETAQWSYVGYGTPTATGSDDHEIGFRIACTYLP